MKPFNFTIGSKMLDATVQQKLLLMLALDASSSMNEKIEPGSATSKIDALNASLKSMFHVIESDNILKHSVEIGILTFSSRIEKKRDFCSVKRKRHAPVITPYGNTKIGEGINASVSMINNRRNQLNAEGTPLLTPILIIISDGKPIESTPDALARAKELSKGDDIVFVPISVGQKQHSFLDELASGKVLEVENFEFGEIFSSIVSASKASLSTASANAFHELMASALSWSQCTKREQ